MKQPHNDCKPTICCDTLFSKDAIFMEKDLIKDNCKCIYKETCLRIAELLLQHNKKEANKLLETIK